MFLVCANMARLMALIVGDDIVLLCAVSRVNDVTIQDLFSTYSHHHGSIDT